MTRVYTEKEVQDIIDDDRAKAFLTGLVCCILCAIGGFVSGAYFASNLYGG